MKKIVTISILFLLFVSSVYSQNVNPAGDKYTVMTSIGASFAIPFDNLKKSYKYGLGGTFDVALPFTKNIAGRFEMTVHDFMYDRDAFLSNAIQKQPDPVNTKFNNATVTGGNAVLMAFKFSFCGGILQPSKKFGIYGIFGVGTYYLSTTDLIAKDNTTSVVDTTINGSGHMYMGLGVGFRASYKISPVASLFLESTCEMFFPSDNWSKASTGAINDWYVPIKLGVMFHPF